MKTSYILKTLVILLFVLTASAQQGINYKAMIKDANGETIANTAITVQFTIIENGTTDVFKESHNPTTDANGIIIVNIGEGTPISGDFSAIDWGSNLHFLNTKIDSGDGLTDMGTTEFKTVPYALYARNSGNIVDLSNFEEGDILQFKGNKIEPALFSFYYRDEDLDSYGDKDSYVYGPIKPAGFVEISGDSDDNNINVNPGAEEICGDQIDNDSDGQIDESCDNDEDGFSVENGDCNDNDNTVNPDATEVCDLLDNNCDGEIDEGCTYTYIPDAKFEQALIQLGHDSDGIVNQKVFTSDISGISSLWLQSKNISDLTGIQDFINLTYLDCSYNQLTSIDLTKNTKLATLECVSNQLTSLDLSQNTQLDLLHCQSNLLTSLDVSKNTVLRTLYCGWNMMSSIDVTSNLELEVLDISNAQLTSLNLSQNISLYQLNCAENQLTSLDLSQNISLSQLNCAENQLTSLDLSQNNSLRTINCGINQLTSLNVSHLSYLSNFNCGSNQLTSLDVSNNPSLERLVCTTNQLSSLNAKNGRNTYLTYFYASVNPLLTCIQIDDETYANTYSYSKVWKKDSSSIYSENCGN